MTKNLRELKVAELKEMAKELKIKNWWTLKKADLITAIEWKHGILHKITVEGPEVVETEATPKKEEEVKPEEITTLKEIALEMNIRGAKARRILRNSEIERPYSRWEWDPQEHAKIIQQVKDTLQKYNK